jgi:hypothetical protein
MPIRLCPGLGRMLISLCRGLGRVLIRLCQSLGRVLIGLCRGLWTGALLSVGHFLGAPDLGPWTLGGRSMIGDGRRFGGGNWLARAIESERKVSKVDAIEAPVKFRGKLCGIRQDWRRCFRRCGGGWLGGVRGRRPRAWRWWGDPPVVGRDWSPVSSNKACGYCCRTPGDH